MEPLNWSRFENGMNDKIKSPLQLLFIIFFNQFLDILHHIDNLYVCMW